LGMWLKGPHPQRVLIATPDVQTLEMTAFKSSFLLMATDGIWDVMHSQYAVNFVLTTLETHAANVKQAADQLAKEAIRLGSVDNVSVVIVLFNVEVEGPAAGESPPPDGDWQPR